MQSKVDSAAGRISVVIPAYNASKYLAAALQSVCDQSVAVREVIVVDDGSTDDTRVLARSLGATVLSVQNGGPSAARNAGTRAASGDYIAFLDADDVWAADKLAEQFAALQSYGRPAFSFTDYRMLDEHGVRKPKSELRRHWAFRKIAGKMTGSTDTVILANGAKPVLYDSYIPPSSVLVRRADALAVGGFDETLRVTEDYEFFLRLLKIVPAIAVMKPLLFYRQHPEQATSNAAQMRSGFFEVARRVAAAPNRYPAADARYIAATEHLRHYSLGMKQSRLGQFDAAVMSLERSLFARWTAGATLALLGSQIGRRPAGRFVYDRARSLWRRRPGR